MDKKRVLFVCVHNSARSQMAEAFLEEYGGGRFEVESAGLEPGRLNPIVVEAMKEVGGYIRWHTFDRYQAICFTFRFKEKCEKWMA